MDNLEPAFNVTRVNSMQWNRSMQVKALEKLENSENSAPPSFVEVSPETIDEIRAAIKTELAEISEKKSKVTQIDSEE